ncbi:MAG: TRAP transporter permease, partial [Ectothiorhodospiraceae bacterium]|nr:TRAP transporter permease [Ectothiorhodospiraceae bacterium]
MTSEQHGGRIIATGVDHEEAYTNQRDLKHWQGFVLFWSCLGYTLFHLLVLNLFPLETWTFRILHVAGGLFIGFALVAAWSRPASARTTGLVHWVQWLPMLAGVGSGAFALGGIITAYVMRETMGTQPSPALFLNIGYALILSVVLSMLASWVFKPRNMQRIGWYDWVLMAASLTVPAYLLFNLASYQFRAGVMAAPA